MSKRSKRILVMFDPHFGVLDEGHEGHDEAAIRTFLKAIPIIRPDEYICGGDVGEWQSCSPWQFKRRKRPPLDYTLERLDRDLIVVNNQMDRIDAALTEVGCAERTLIEGNHEVWVRDMVGEVGIVGDAYDLSKQLHLGDRGYAPKMIPFGEFIHRGKLALYHGGHYVSQHHAAAHATKCGHSIMYGHVHDVQAATVPSMMGPHGAYSMGCCCYLPKGFLKGRLTNWQHAFGVVNLREDGTFLVTTYRIQDGWTVVQGKEITGGKLQAGRSPKEIV